MQTLLILGARGDLTARLLLPGLGVLVAASSLDGLYLIGSDRRNGRVPLDDYRAGSAGPQAWEDGAT